MPTPEVVARDVHAKALELADLTQEEVNIISRRLPTRFNGFAADVWEVGAVSPAPGWIVFAIFTGGAYDPNEDHVDGDVRVYCIPAIEGAPFAFFKVSRTVPTGYQTCFKSTPVQDEFATEIAAEWNAIASSMGLIVDDAETMHCETCGNDTALSHEDEEREVDEASFCGHCGARFSSAAITPEIASAGVVS